MQLGCDVNIVGIKYKLDIRRKKKPWKWSEAEGSVGPINNPRIQLCHPDVYIKQKERTSS